MKTLASFFDQRNEAHRHVERFGCELEHAIEARVRRERSTDGAVQSPQSLGFVRRNGRRFQACAKWVPRCASVRVQVSAAALGT